MKHYKTIYAVIAIIGVALLITVAGANAQEPNENDFLNGGQATVTPTDYGVIYTFLAPGQPESNALVLRCFHEEQPTDGTDSDRIYDETCYQRIDLSYRVAVKGETTGVGFVIRRGFFDLLRSSIEDPPLYDPNYTPPPDP